MNHIKAEGWAAEIEVAASCDWIGMTCCVHHWAAPTPIPRTGARRTKQIFSACSDTNSPEIPLVVDQVWEREITFLTCRVRSVIPLFNLCPLAFKGQVYAIITYRVGFPHLIVRTPDRKNSIPSGCSSCCEKTYCLRRSSCIPFIIDCALDPTNSRCP
jgi:hypothetical protein